MGNSGNAVEALGSNGGGGIAATIFMLVYFAFIILMLVSMWKVFTKAGQPGWGIIIPIYNVYLACKIAGKPGWWLLLFLIPLVNIIVAIILPLSIAKNFGKSGGFAVGLIFLPFIFYPMLAFGSAEYTAQIAE